MASVAYHLNNQMLKGDNPKLFEGCDGFPNGGQTRDFVYVADVCQVILWFWKHQGQSGIFNCGTGRAEPFQNVARITSYNVCYTKLLRPLGLLPVDEEGPHVQVLLHRQTGEDASPLRDYGDIAAHDLGGVAVSDVAALEQDASAGRRRIATDGHQQGALAGAIGSDQGDDLPLVDMQADIIERLDLAVEGGDVA